VSWTDRLEKVLTGFGGAIQAPLGLAKDFAIAWNKDDPEFDGFWNVLIGRSAARAGQVGGNLFGPDEGLGAVIGGLPEKQIRQPVNKAFEGLEWTWREGISEPIQTLQYVNERTDPVKGDGWGAVLNSGVWSRGYELANRGDGSPGRNLAFSVLNTELDDDEGRRQAEASALFGPLSGLIDGALRLGADPTVLVAGGAGAARKALIVKPIKPGKTNLDEVMGTNRLTKVKEEMEGKNAAEIRDRFFPNTPGGGQLASVLADADTAGKDRILRLAMGDLGQLRKLQEERADLAGRIERLVGTQDDLLASLDGDNFSRVNGLDDSLSDADTIGRFQSAGQGSWVEGVRPLDASFFAGRKRKPPGGLSREEDDAFAGGLAAVEDELTRAQRELNVLYDKEARNFRDEHLLNTITAQPRATLSGKVRSEVTRSSFYQESLAAKPLRVVFNIRPERFIRVEEVDGDFNVNRYLKKTGWVQEQQDEWRSRYMGALDPESRAQVLVDMEDAAVDTLAKNAGMTPDEVLDVMREITRGRTQAREALGRRTFDGEGRSRVSYQDDATGVVHEIPLMVPQNVNVVPLADLDAARKALTWIGEFKRLHPTTQILPEMAEALYRVWKPAMLLRVGWTVRSLTDAQLRIAAKVGALSQLRYLKPGLDNMVGNAFNRTLASIDNGGTTAERRQAARDADETRIGFGTQTVRGYEVEKSFGLDPKNPVAERAMASSGAAFNRIIGQAERMQEEKLRKATGEYRSLDPVKDAKDYDPSWVRDVNEQIGRDLIARQFLEGKSYDEVLAWTKTPDGRKHLARLPQERRRNVRNTVGAIQEQVESYTLGDPDIMRAALARRATIADLDKATEGVREARPIIHGEILADVRGQSAINQVVNGFVTEAYRILGTLPEDTLARHGFFDTLYNAELSRQIGLLDEQAKKMGGRLTSGEIALVQNKARKYALDQVRRTLYDFADQSEFAHMLKFLSPFYVAWQEAFVKWAGLALENPAFTARGRLLWQSPERAGLVVDENGNEVGLGQDTGDTVRYPDGTTSVIGRERFVRFPLPKGLSKIVGLDGLETQGEVTFSKKSANFILQASPGFGPVVTIPVQKIVRDRPQLEESVRFILPYGVGEGALDSILPSTARRALAQNKGEEDRVFRNTALRILNDQVTDYRLGKRTAPPNWAEAKEQASALYKLRTVAAYVMPVLPGFKSPYQPYLDKFRRLRAQDPENAEARFLDEEGEEFFALTQSFTKSNDGIPPTKEAYAARGQFRDLIEKYPEFGRLIVGDDAASGAYAASIYRSQSENKVGPNSNLMQREALSVQEVLDGPNVRQGWILFRRAMDGIEAARVERGLPNLRVKGAADLAEIKRQVIEKLSEKFPEWYDDFSIVDRNAQAKRIAGLRALAAHERLVQRPDIAGVRTYLELRDHFTYFLAQRDKAGGSAQLDAASNLDIATAWDTVKSALAERNPAFAPVLYRYLDRDDLAVA
jgi:hypothetical protein